MEKKEWQKYSVVLKELFNLEYSPVAVSCSQKPLKSEEKKVRICRAILDAGRGQTLQIGKKTNACFGAGWHLGFYRLSNPKISKLIENFVVEGEKLFSSYEALNNIVRDMPEPPDNSKNYFLLSPLENAEFNPQVVIFICNPEVACRLLTFITFTDGLMPKIKIGGPTCRLAIIYPMVSGEVNLSFYDYTARKMCNVDKDKLLVSIPYKRIPKIIEDIDKCSAGTAKIEYPQKFREFLQKQLTK